MSIAYNRVLLPALSFCLGVFMSVGVNAGAGQALIETSHGNMLMTFFPEDAPATVANFKRLVNEGWYEGKTFYRVVKGHVIQAGSNVDNEQPLVGAEFNQNPHIKGAVGLARGEDPDSGSTEIYICHEARPHLNGRYTVFGQLSEGFDVLDKIASSEVKEEWLGDDKKIAFHGPVEVVTIVRITLSDSI